MKWVRVTENLEVSNCGLCRRNGRVWPGAKTNGSFHVCVNGGNIAVYVLVLNAFRKNPKPDFYDRTDHVNGNTKYNHIRNLRFSNTRLNGLNQVHARGWNETLSGTYQE